MNICCINKKRFVSHKKYFNVVQKLKLVFINVNNFLQRRSILDHIILVRKNSKAL